MYTRFFGSIETLENRIAIRDIESVENWFPSENKLKTSPPLYRGQVASSSIHELWALSWPMGKKHHIFKECGFRVAWMACARHSRTTARTPLPHHPQFCCSRRQLDSELESFNVIKTKQRPQPPSKWPKHPPSPRVMSDSLLLLALTNSLTETGFTYLKNSGRKYYSFALQVWLVFTF